MTGAGIAEAIAGPYVEMGNAIGSDVLFKDFNQYKPEVLGSTKLTDFVKELATVYKQG